MLNFEKDFFFFSLSLPPRKGKIFFNKYKGARIGGGIIVPLDVNPDSFATVLLFFSLSLSPFSFSIIGYLLYSLERTGRN